MSALPLAVASASRATASLSLCCSASGNLIAGLSCLRASAAGAPWKFSTARLGGGVVELRQGKVAVEGARRRRSCAVQTTMAVATEVVDVLVKAATGEPSKLGDCPFSQRVLLTLEEKKIPYEAKFIDTSNKPDWFLEINPEGKVPVIKFEGKWIADSDVIVGLLEKNYPDISLLTPEEVASVGSKFFPAFVKFLKSNDATDETEANFKSELKALDDHFAKSPGPFIAGEKVTAVDLSLAPKLYHASVALKNYKGWTIPEEYTHVVAYMKALFELESFKKTAASEEIVIAGWKRALGL